MKTREIFIVSCVLFLALALSPFAHAAETPLDKISPAAREAFEKGMLAVEQKEWLVAIDYFEKAQKIDKYAEQITFNLGLAESKLPNRELRALAWFKAYLEMSGSEKDPNREAVIKECARQEVRADATVKKMTQQAMKFSAQLSGASKRSCAYSKIALAQSMAGDFSGAKRTLEMMTLPTVLELDYGGVDCNYKGLKDAVLSNVLRNQALAGDYAGARETADLRSKADRASSLNDIATLEKQGKPSSMGAWFFQDMIIGDGTRGAPADLRKRIFTDMTEELKDISSRQKPEDIVAGYIEALTTIAKALHHIKSGTYY